MFLLLTRCLRADSCL
jgi:hypothetical protein